MVAHVRGGALALLGAAWFLLVQRAHDHFYGQFGVNTTEVGVDLSVVAYRAAYSFLLYGILFLFPIWSMTFMMERVWPKTWSRLKGAFRERRLTRWITETFGIPRRLVVATVLMTAFFAAYILMVTVPGRLLGDRIRRGESVLTVNEVLPVLWVHAERVSLQWIDAAEPRTLPGGQAFMYLGANDGIIVLYDLCNESALRVPAERVMLSAVEPESPIASTAC
jgi:hypothetical protein